MAASDRQWRANLKYLYGLDAAEYDQLLAAQKGRCAICARVFGRRRPCVDHDHGTGAVRGLLCLRCNTFLGMLENIGLRDAAVMYLHMAELNRK